MYPKQKAVDSMRKAEGKKFPVAALNLALMMSVAKATHTVPAISKILSLNMRFNYEDIYTEKFSFDCMHT